MAFTAETLDTFVQESVHLGDISKKSLKVLSEKNLVCGYATNRLNVCRCYD